MLPPLDSFIERRPRLAAQILYIKNIFEAKQHRKVHDLQPTACRLQWLVACC